MFTHHKIEDMRQYTPRRLWVNKSRKVSFFTAFTSSSPSSSPKSGTSFPFDRGCPSHDMLSTAFWSLISASSAVFCSFDTWFSLSSTSPRELRTSTIWRKSLRFHLAAFFKTLWISFVLPFAYSHRKGSSSSLQTGVLVQKLESLNNQDLWQRLKFFNRIYF